MKRINQGLPEGARHRCQAPVPGTYGPIFGLVCFVLMIAFGTMVAYSVNKTFVQTTWAGGASAVNAVHPTNQTGWDKYSAKDAGLDASQAGKLTLSATTTSIVDSTNTDFNKGTHSKTTVTGTGTAATVDLVPTIDDPFVSSLRKFPEPNRLRRVPYQGADYVLVTSPAVKIYAIFGNNSNIFASYDPATAKWTSLADTPGHVYLGSALAYPGSGDYIYAIGGGYTTKDFWRYTISTNTWSTLADLPIPAREGTRMAAPGDGFIYTIFGQTTNVHKYDITAGTWSAALAANPVTPGYGSEFIKGDGTKIYYLQGNNGGAMRSYDYSAGTWSVALTAMPLAKVAGQGAFYRASNNSIYVMRGGGARQFYRYDVTGNSWDQTLESTPFIPYYGSGAVYVSGTDTAYLFPGAGNRDPVNFDFASGGWLPKSGQPWNSYSAGSHRAVWYNGKMYVLASYPNVGQFSSYDPTTNRWTTLAVAPAPPLAGNNGTSITVNPNDGQIYSIPQGSNTVATSRFYRYNATGATVNGLAANTWSAALADPPAYFSNGANLAYVRIGASDYIYALRGGNTTTFWRYDIAANTWDLTPPAVAPATVAEGGTLLWPGSGDYIYAIRGNAFTAFWRYTISTNTWDTTTLAQLPVAAFYSADMVLSGDGAYIYVIPGNYSPNFYRYTIATNTWTRMTDLPQKTYSYSQFLVYNPAANKIYFNPGHHANMMEYDVAANTWTMPASNSFDENQYVYDRQYAVNQASLIYPGTGDYLYHLQQGGTKYFWRYSITNDRWEIMADAPLHGSVEAAMSEGGTDTLYMMEGTRTPNFYKYTISTNTWTQLANLSDGTTLDFAYFPSLSYDATGGAVYAVVGDATTKFRKYTILSNAWAAAPALLSNAGTNYHNHLSNVVTVSGTRYIYAAAYSGNATRYRFNINSNVWESSFTNSAAPFGLGAGNHQYAVGGDLYVMRGGTNAEFWKYNLASGTWTTLKEVPMPAAYGMLAGSSDPNILYATSYIIVANNVRMVLMKYNIALNKWSQASSQVTIAPDAQATMPYSYSGAMGYAGKNSSLYMSNGNNTATFYRYDTAQDKWNYATTLPWPANVAGYGTNLAYDGGDYLYMPRGRNGVNFARYKVGSDAWEVKANMPSATYYGGMVYDGNNTLYMLHGASSGSGNFSKYSISGDSWTGLSIVPAGTAARVLFGGLAYPGSGDFLYALRGDSTSDFMRYSISGNSWNTTALQAPPLTISLYSNAFLYPGFGNHFYLVTQNSPYVWRYNFGLNTWDRFAMTNFVGKQNSTMAFDESGFLYINDGLDEHDGTFGLTHKVQIAAVGTYTSDIKTLGKNSGFGAMTWTDNATQSIRMKVRSSNDAGMSGAKDWRICPFVTKGQDISALSSVTDGHKFVQYQIVYATDDIAQVPTVSDVTLNYTRVPTEATLTSSAFNTTANRNRALKLLWTETRPTGSDVRLQIRTAPDSVGAPGTWTNWLGPGGTTTVNSDFSNAADYSKSDQIKISAGAASLYGDVENFLYKQAVKLDNTGGAAQTNVAAVLNIVPGNNAFWSHVKSDGADIRFHDGTNKLTYWLQSWNWRQKSAVVHVKIPSISAGQVKTIYMLYGSQDAISESDVASRTYHFVHRFTGLTLDTALFTTTGCGTVSQNNELTVTNDADAWDCVVATIDPYDDVRVNGRSLRARVKPATGTTVMMGWHDAGTGVSYTDLVYAVYFNAGAFVVYEDGNNRASPATYTQGQWYEIKITLKNAGGATFYYRADGGGAWIQLYDSTYSTESWLRPAIVHNKSASNTITDDWIVTDSDGDLIQFTGPVYFTVTETAGTSASLSGWSNKVALTVDNTANAATLTNHQVAITLDGWDPFWTKVKSDGADIRVVDSDDLAVLNHFTQKFDYTAKTGKVWVKVPSIPASATKTIYIYYGNAAATTTSSAANTMIAFDDFNDGTVSGWDAYTSGTWTETNGRLQEATNSTWSTLARTLTGAPNDYIIEVSARLHGTGANQRPGVYFRWTGNPTPTDTLKYYAFAIENSSTAGSDYRRLVIRDYPTYATANWTNLWQKPYGDYNESGDRKIEIRVKGSTYKVYVDDVLEADVTDNRIPAGSVVALQKAQPTTGWTTQSFDDFLVRAVADSDPLVVAPAVEAANTYSSSGNYTSNPVVQPIFGAFYNNDLAEFLETATKPVGTEIKYQVSPNGYDWYYYVSAAWAKTTGGFAQANTAAEVQTNLSSFMSTVASSGEFFFRAFLNSNGSATPTLDNISIRKVTGTTFYTDPSGAEAVDAMHKDAVNDQWMQYKVILNSDGTAVPELLDVTPEYDTASVALTSPVGGETWIIGTSRNITWTSNGLDASDTIKIEYSTNNGSTWTTVSAGAANTGTYAWTAVPDTPSTQVLVKLTSVGLPVITSQSGSAFTIAGTITVTAPNGTEVWPAGSSRNITWTHHGIPGTTVKIEFSSNGGTTYPTTVATGVAKGAAESGTYSWTVANTLTTQGRIKITDETNSVVTDPSNANFEIGGSVISVTKPASAEVVGILTVKKINWDITGPIPTGATIKMEYSSDGLANNDVSKVWNLIDQNIGAASGTGCDAGAEGCYDWAVPSAAASSTVVVRIVDRQSDTSNWSSLSGGQDAVDGYSGVFRVTGTITVQKPNGGEKWAAGAAHTITYQKQGSIANVKISYSTDNFSTSTVITASTSATGSYSWTPVRADAGTNMKIRVEDAADSAVKDESDAVFSLSGITVTAPSAAARLKANDPLTITWTQVGVANVKIDYAEDGTNYTNSIIATTPVGANSYAWTLPLKTMTGLRVKVSDADAVPAANGTDTALTFDNSDASTVLYGTVTLTAPNGNEDWAASQPHDVTWTVSPSGANVVPNVKIFYTTSSFATETLELDSGTAKPSNNNPGNGTGKYSWSPAFTANTVKLRIVDAGDPAVSAGAAAPSSGQNQDDSDAFFQVSGISITAPASAASWLVGSSQNVTFGFTGTLNNVKIEYTVDGGTSWTTLSANTSVTANPFNYAWTIPDNISTNAKVRVTEVNADGSAMTGGKSATSAVFTITGSLTITTPATLKVGDSATISWTKVGTISSQTLAYSTDGGTNYTNIATALTGTSQAWTVPDSIGNTVKVRVTDTTTRANGSPAMASASSNFSIKSNITITAPVVTDKWGANRTYNITGTMTGTVSNIKIEHVEVSSGTATTIVASQAVSGGTFTYSWGIPATILNAARNLATDPAKAYKIRVTDVTTGHTGNAAATLDSANFDIVYYKITWAVRDSASSGLLSLLSVAESFDGDGSTTWSVSDNTLNSSGLFRYNRYGTYTTSWSKALYSNAGANSWVADSDKTVTVYLESDAEKSVQYDVVLIPVLDENADKLNMKTWLARLGKIGTNEGLFGTATITIFDGTTIIATLTKTGAQQDLDVSQAVGARSIGYSFSYGPPTNMTAGKVYFIRSAIAYSGSTYTSGNNYTVPGGTKPITDLIGAIGDTSSVNSLFGKIAATLNSSTLAQTSAASAVTKTDEVKALLGAVGDAATANTIFGALGGKADATSADTLFGKLAKVTAFLGDPSTTGTPAAGSLAAEMRNQWKALNRDPLVKTGDKTTLSFKGTTGATVTADIYDPKNVKIASAVALTEVGTTGIYQVADQKFTKAGQHTVLFKTSTGAMDSMVINVVPDLPQEAAKNSKDAKDSAASAFVFAQKAAGDTSNILADLGSLTHGSASKDPTAALATIQASMAELQSQMSTIFSSPERTNLADVNNKVEDVLGLLRTIMKSGTGKKELDPSLENIFTATRKAVATVTDVQNTARKVEAMTETTQKMIERQDNKPVVTTWFETGSVILKLLVINPSETEAQDFALHAYLPKEVKPEIIERITEGIEVEFDAERDSYFAKGMLKLKPGETRLIEIEMTDIWVIEESRLTDLKDQASKLFDQLRDTPYEGRAEGLFNNVVVLLTQIFETQNDDSVTPEEHIQAYRENMKKVRDIELDLVAMRRFIATAADKDSELPTGGEVPEFLKGVTANWNSEGDAAEKGPGPSVKATWKLIFGIMAFIGFVGVVSFGIWQTELHRLLKVQKGPGPFSEHEIASPPTIVADRNDAASPPSQPSTHAA